MVSNAASQDCRLPPIKSPPFAILPANFYLNGHQNLLQPSDSPSLASLKEAGSRAFAMKKYEEAMASWDRALEMESLSNSDAALLHNNKAACYMVGKRYRDAVSECTAALEIQPNYLKALVRRAKANEAMGQFKLALSDLQQANALDGATDDTRAAEKRVKELAAGKVNGAPAQRKTSMSALGGAGGSGPSRQVTVPVKLRMGDDTRSFTIVPNVSYTELMEHARNLFPNVGPFVLKVVDKEGDLITIASRADINRAIQEAVDSVDRKRIAQGQIPAIRLEAVRVSSVDEIPKAPEDEVKYVHQVLEQLQKLQALQGGKTGTTAAGANQQAANQPAVVVDEWILAFVDLLKEHTGIDPDRTVEVQEVGNDKLNTAFQAMMNNDPKADDLLTQAEAKFQEAAAMGMACQAQVWETKAQLVVQRAAVNGADASSIAAEAESHLSKAEAKAKEALNYCAALLDAHLVLSSIEQARAKIAANYLLEPVPPREDITDAKERQAAEEKGNRAAIAKAFERVTAESSAAADAYMERAYAHIKAALEAMPEEEKTKELKPLKPLAEQDPSDPEDHTPMKANLLINLGNAHYEHSILRAAGGLDWRSLVEQAKSLFEEAGAAASDIQSALKGHPKADDMQDLVAETVESEDKKESEEGPKGVPALAPRKKK